MRYIHRHVVATIVAASFVGAQASSPASARIMEPTPKSDSVGSVSAHVLPQGFKTDAAQSGAGATQNGGVATLPSGFSSDAAQAGREVARSVALPPIFATDAAQAGRDADRPTATAPTTVEVVRPERTIVRDVDEALPLIFSGTALALALAGLAMTLVYVRALPRAGSSH